ncbi:DsbA family protein [Bacillus sp. 165]|uniref:DsbA family protein n=1 Tax=Bacillus sp. 165 TaxID=1529117 RepID=UPI001AD99CB3|nr:DsbA family protein [Bacillus sp. 165]MBO9130424.1 thioredoxin domain-containing protein [Bacillus sp. 165]
MGQANRKQKKKNTSKSSSKWIFWTIGVFSVCILGLLFMGNWSSSKEVAIDYKDQPYLGDKTAPVKILEFGDYKCPYCKNFNELFLPQIEKELIETGQAKFYFINYAFINVDSTRAAQFGETVYQVLGNDMFWKFHERLYSKQPEDMKYEKIDLYTETFLTDTLKEVANEDDVEKVVQAFETQPYKEALKKDESYVQKLNVQSTPSLFVNGKQFEGNSFEDLKKMVEQAAKEKKDE